MCSWLGVLNAFQVTVFSAYNGCLEHNLIVIWGRSELGLKEVKCTLLTKISLGIWTLNFLNTAMLEHLE